MLKMNSKLFAGIHEAAGNSRAMRLSAHDSGCCKHDDSGFCKHYESYQEYESNQEKGET